MNCQSLSQIWITITKFGNQNFQKEFVYAKNSIQTWAQLCCVKIEETTSTVHEYGLKKKIAH